MRTLLALCLFVLASAPAAAQGAKDGTFEILVEELQGDELCSIKARNASVQEMLEEIARQTGRELEGFQHSETNAGVTVRLNARPLDQALHYMLGTVGLRAETTSRTIFVRPDLPPFAEREDLLDAADLAYQRALSYNPGSTQGDDAEMALGQIAEELGNLAKARSHFEYLVDRFPYSGLVPEAMHRAAVLHMADGNWDNAAVLLRDLIELDVQHQWIVPAYIGLARSSTHLGNHDHAIYGLNDIDRRFPASTPTERGERNYVRARALIGRGDYVEALRVLQRRNTVETPGHHPGERVELIAAALELSGHAADAAIAWLEYSQTAVGKERERAFVQAAELALTSGDEVGVMMIARQAQRDGYGPSLRALLHEARAQLDLVDQDLNLLSRGQRMDRANHLVGDGRFHDAYVVLNPVAAEMALMSVDELHRFALLYAEPVEVEEGVNSAVRLLREVLPRMLDIDQRREIYLLAARLYEKNEKFDQAIEAYGGKL